MANGIGTARVCPPGPATFLREPSRLVLRLTALEGSRCRLDRSDTWVPPRFRLVRRRRPAGSVSLWASGSEDGLLQFGHNKDHHPDLPQVKVMQAVLVRTKMATNFVTRRRTDCSCCCHPGAFDRAGTGGLRG